MTLATPTRKQIQAQVESVLKHHPDAKAIGIRSPGLGEWGNEVVSAGGRRFSLVWCESSLAAREAMVSRPEETGLVMLTALPETDLGDDLVARLARARLLRIDAWEMVREAFKAINIDTRLSRKTWMADLLLAFEGEGYPAAAGGFLDADTAWRHLLMRVLDIPSARPDADTLLRWTVGEGLSRFGVLPAEAREGIATWLGEAGGPAGGLVMACVASGFGVDALPLGLTAGVIFAETLILPDLTAAAVRLEPFVGGRRIQATDGRAWAEASARTLGTLAVSKDPRAHLLLERADALLSRLHASDHAGLSAVLLSGFEARLEAVAPALAAFVEKRGRNAEEVEKASAWALAHDQARVQEERAESLLMAVRLTRWLARTEAPVASFSTAAALYAEEGAFVDRARAVLAGGDDLASLNAAYAALSAAARARREEQNRLFARRLSEWRPAPGPSWPLVPVERILDEVVAPIAKDHPVLLLVMDGLSLAVSQELLPDLTKAGWSEMAPSGAARQGCGVAALPTVTEISRASLLSGRLTRGGQGVEKNGFAEHPALRAASRSGQPPIVFHKGELGRDGLLSEAIRAAIDTPEQRVVGIVYNAVDDHLDGSDQFRHRWRLAGSGILRPILRAARDAGRMLVLTADHGHLPEAGTRNLDGGDGERWRNPDGPLAHEEIAFTQGRVLTPTGQTSVVLPWSETVRYAGSKNGYHGGASPQEVLVPLVILACTETSAAWTAAPPIEPDWWNAALPAPGPASAPAPSRRKKPAPGHADLFAGTPSAASAAPADWMERLFASETYAAQRQLAGRGAPSEDNMRLLLEALSERNKLGQVALAQRVGMAQVRIGGLIMAARRVLNVDQTKVLDIEEGSCMVVLDRELLETQFGLKR